MPLPEFLKVHFLRFPTSCSAHRSPRIPESAFLLRFPTSCSAHRNPRIPESPFSENKFCPRQRSCPGQVGCSKTSSTFERKFYPRQRSCPGQVACSKNLISGKKFYPRQRSCPGQVASSTKVGFLKRSSAPGSEAARDKWLLQNKSDF